MKTQIVLDDGVLPLLQKLLKSTNNSLKKETCYAISNITGSRCTKQIQSVIDANIIPPHIDILTNSKSGMEQNEAAWAISNALSEIVLRAAETNQVIVNVTGSGIGSKAIDIGDIEQMSKDAAQLNVTGGTKRIKATIGNTCKLDCFLAIISNIEALRPAINAATMKLINDYFFKIKFALNAIPRIKTELRQKRISTVLLGQMAWSFL
eukprot:gene3860-4461_t